MGWLTRRHEETPAEEAARRREISIPADGPRPTASEPATYYASTVEAFEYKTVKITGVRQHQDRDINKWVSKGWELVEIRNDQLLRGWNVAYLRRLTA